jgi:tight adherence protein C
LGVLFQVRGISDRRELAKRVKTPYGEVNPAGNAAPLDLSRRSGNVFQNFLSMLGGKINPGRTTDNKKINLRFLRAGYREKNVPTIFWGVKFLLAVGLPMAFLASTVLFFKSLDRVQILYAFIFLSLLGLFLPDYWLRRKTARRRKNIIRAFPDALDLMVVCVEAGMGLDATIHRVGLGLDLANSELSEEFKLMNLEMRAGISRQTALRNLSKRTDVEDVNSLVTLLIQSERFGTSVAQALRVFSNSFRTARYQKAEEFAAKIGTKLIFPLVLFIFPSMLIVMLGPVAIKVYRTFYG